MAEEKVASAISEAMGKVDESARVLFPEKILIEQHGRTTLRVRKPLIPGYLVLESKATVIGVLESARATKGAAYLLRYGDTREYKLHGSDREYALWVFKNNGLIEPTKAIMKPGQPIRIIEGPMKDMVGSIYRISRRGRRATVIIPFRDTEIKVTLAIEFLEEE